jgi:hypothetical protein
VARYERAFLRCIYYETRNERTAVVTATPTPTFEGFYEDLARQNTVALLFQLQLWFRRRRIWVSMLSHMGFSRRRGVLMATI